MSSFQLLPQACQVLTEAPKMFPKGPTCPLSSSSRRHEEVSHTKRPTCTGTLRGGLNKASRKLSVATRIGNLRMRSTVPLKIIDVVAHVCQDELWCPQKPPKCRGELPKNVLPRQQGPSRSVLGPSKLLIPLQRYAKLSSGHIVSGPQCFQWPPGASQRPPKRSQNPPKAKKPPNWQPQGPPKVSQALRVAPKILLRPPNVSRKDPMVPKLSPRVLEATPRLPLKYPQDVTQKSSHPSDRHHITTCHPTTEQPSHPATDVQCKKQPIYLAIHPSSYPAQQTGNSATRPRSHQSRTTPSSN